MIRSSRPTQMLLITSLTTMVAVVSVADASPPTTTKATVSSAAYALIFDLTKLVHLQSQGGWRIDHYELRDLIPEALMSVCQVAEQDTEAASSVLRHRIDALGGPVNEAWQRAGRDLDAVSSLLLISRVHALLRLAREARSNCPFYFKADPRFAGRHTDTHHLTLNVEGGGLFSVRRVNGEWNFGGGGSGRFTTAYAPSPSHAIRAGLEVGGAALVSKDISAKSLDIDFFMAVPVTMRWLTPKWHYDFEMAAIAVGVPWRDQLRYGVRVGTMLGLTYKRVRSVLPWGGYSVNFEYVFPRGGQPGQWTVRSGFRVGFNLRALRL